VAQAEAVRTRFLALCSERDRCAFENVFSQIDGLAEELKSRDSSICLCLRFDDHRKSAALELVHRKLTSPASLCWAWPSEGVARGELPSSLSAPERELTNLSDADFEKKRDCWRTKCAGEPNGISRVFNYPANLQHLRLAVRRLVERVDCY
jgi:hypothetical protein